MQLESSEVLETKNYKVVVYPASRQFTTKEVKDISEKVYDFLGTWQAHGKDLYASFKIEKNQFLIVCVDMEKEVASGCSIGNMNDYIREIDQQYQLGFFDRMKACYVDDGEVKTMKLQQFKQGLKDGSIPKDIAVFDFSKDNYLDFSSDFLLPLEDSWAGAYL